MTRSLCQGPLTLLVLMLLGGVLTSVAAWAIHLIVGVLAWYWFVLLYVLCFAVSVFFVTALGYLVTRCRRLGKQRR